MPTLSRHLEHTPLGYRYMSCTSRGPRIPPNYADSLKDRDPGYSARARAGGVLVAIPLFFPGSQREPERGRDYNDSIQELLIVYGSGGSTTNFSYTVPAGETFEMPLAV